MSRPAQKGTIQRCMAYLVRRHLAIAVSVAILCARSLPAETGGAQNPDARATAQILYERHSGIWVMNADGTAQKELVSHGNSPVCTPDGKAIIFVKRESGASGIRDLYTMRRDGREVTRLTKGLRVASKLTPSSDGGHVAFVQVESSVQTPSSFGLRALTRVSAIDLETRIVSDLTENLPLITRLEWSPDGSSIAFVSESDDQNTLYVLNVANKIASKSSLRQWLDCSLSWAPDSKRLAVACGGIRILELPELTARRVQLPQGVSATSVAWSPASDMLAFRSEPGCNGTYCGDVYTIRPDGTDRRKVSNTRFFRCRCYRDPQWSPDGSTVISIAYRSKGDMDFNPFHRNIPPSIYAMDANRPRERILTNDGETNGADPVYCPVPPASLQ
jgi:Tol biopolymer transport system component